MAKRLAGFGIIQNWNGPFLTLTLLMHMYLTPESTTCAHKIFKFIRIIKISDVSRSATIRWVFSRQDGIRVGTKLVVEGKFADLRNQCHVILSNWPQFETIQ